MIFEIGSIILKKEGKQPYFEIDQHNMTPIVNIIRYLTGQVKHPKNLYKGLLLHGDVGTGKTLLMKIMIELMTHAHKIMHVISAVYIVDAYKYKDYHEIKRFERGIICIDEMGGEEAELKDYGTNMHPVYDILNKRYLTKRLTFVTTNLTPSQIEERYGLRIRDRLKEMCNAIPMTGPSRRK